MSLDKQFNTILLEGEMENIINKRRTKMLDTIIDLPSKINKSFDFYTEKFIANIPTPKKYISKFYDLVEEEHEHTASAIDICFDVIYNGFNKWMIYKSKNIIKKDIMAQSSESLLDIVSEIDESERKKLLEGKVKKIYDDGKWLAIRVNSKEASCKYGSNTQWCISALNDNRFNGYGYSENNHIYFIIDRRDRIHNDDVLYKMAVLINKKTRFIEVWNAKDKRLSHDNVDIVWRFLPEVFKAISQDVNTAQDDIDDNYIDFMLNNEYSLKKIKNYKRTSFKFDKESSLISLNYTLFNNPNHFIKIFIDINNNTITSNFYYRKLINNDKTGERYYDFVPTILISKVSNEDITKSNFKNLIKSSLINLLNTPEVKKYFLDNPNDYFNSVKLYQGIETMGTKKVPQDAFITAIKLLKEKGEQNITTIRRIVDPRLLSSHNVKPLLRSLYSFGLIKLEKRGSNVMIVPTPKLVKTSLDKLI